MFSGTKWLTTRGGYMPPLSVYYVGIVHVDVAAAAAAFPVYEFPVSTDAK